MQMHVIRLRGPWEYEFVSDESAGRAARGTVQFPGEWPGDVAEISGIVRLTRRFHRPTGLDDNERVWLALSGLGGTLGVKLNEQPLIARHAAEEIALATAREQAFRQEVSSLLGPRNTLIVELLKRADEPQLRGLVCLEIGASDG